MQNLHTQLKAGFEFLEAYAWLYSLLLFLMFKSKKVLVCQSFFIVTLEPYKISMSEDVSVAKRDINYDKFGSTLLRCMTFSAIVTHRPDHSGGIRPNIQTEMIRMLLRLLSRQLP